MLSWEDDLILDEQTYLVKVVWTNGEIYIEHPADLNLVLKIKEVPNGEE